jgi:hypothetical protein
LINIDSILLNDDIVTSKFCCDLSECKGVCCCLIGGRGAPINDDESEILKEVYKKIEDTLSPAAIEVIKKEGLYEGTSGELYITCIKDRDCIFVYHENKIAKCLIEKAFNEWKISWRKPISCHLYPIRINYFGGDVLKYSKIPECKPAVKNGKEKNIFMIEFLKEPLIRKYGQKWYDELNAYFVIKRPDKI